MALSRPVLITASAAVVLVLDQWSKDWAVGRLSDGSSIEVALGVEFRLAFNQGMAFSKFSGGGPIIGMVAVGIVLGLAWFSRSLSSRWAHVVVGVVMGGALGNVWDRLFRAPIPGNPTGFMRGAVVDFLYTSWWPTFNVADSAVVVGGILLAIITWRTPETPVAPTEESVAPPEPDAAAEPPPTVESPPTVRPAPDNTDAP